MYNRTVAALLLDTKDDFVSFCLSRSWELAGTAVFMLTIPWSRKFWLSFVNTLLFIQGLATVLFPRVAINAVTEGEPDAMHVQLSLCVGLVMVCSALCYWLLMRSTDSTTATSILWTHTLVTGCLLLAQGYVLTHPGKKSASIKFDPQLLSSGFYITLLMFVGCLYHALRSGDWGGYGQMATHANVHLRLDFLMLMMMGVLMYALPQWMLRIATDLDKLDSVHAYGARAFGALLIGMATMSGRAANFLRGNDKDCVVVSHWLVYIALMLVNLYGLLTSWTQQSWTRVALSVLPDIIIIANATGALDVDVTVFKRIVLPRIREIPADLSAMCCLGCLKWRRY